MFPDFPYARFVSGEQTPAAFYAIEFPKLWSERDSNSTNKSVWKLAVAVSMARLFRVDAKECAVYEQYFASIGRISTSLALVGFTESVDDWATKVDYHREVELSDDELLSAYFPFVASYVWLAADTVLIGKPLATGRLAMLLNYVKDCHSRVKVRLVMKPYPDHSFGVNLYKLTDLVDQRLFYDPRIHFCDRLIASWNLVGDRECPDERRQLT